MVKMEYSIASIMTIPSYTSRVVLAVVSLLPWCANSASAAARTIALADSSFTSTNVVVSRAWSEVFGDDEQKPEEEEVEIERAKTIKVGYVDITAYSAVEAECDSDPLVTADGSVVTVVPNIIAANHLPFGTKLRIPGYFGDRVFEVRDRMNARYRQRIDILMTDAKEAREWGLKRKAKVEIIEMGTNAHKWNDPEMKEARKLVAKKVKQ